MELYNLPNDVKLICATATSFPDGIQDAFRKLENTIPNVQARTFYGISYKNQQGVIIYKAAVSEISEDEAEEYGFETFNIGKGTYLTETITDWKDNMDIIGPTFQKLLEDKRLDTSFPCVEWYRGDGELLCMIKIDPSKT